MSFVGGGVAALLVVALTVPSCEDGESPEPVIVKVPVSNFSGGPRDISLTQVLEMARIGDLQSIAVSGDKLEVNTLDGETFVSREVAGTSIKELSDREGVDHLASGLQIVATGSGAQE